MAVPRYRPYSGLTLFSAGFRPFFLAAAIWAAIAVPLWLAAFADGLVLPGRLPPLVWHAHEMIFGFGAAAVAGFMLTAIPNWTGRLPLQGRPLAGLLALWLLGRVAVLVPGTVGAPVAAAADLSFPAVFLAVVAREIVVGRNWRNLAMVAALALLLVGNLLVHLGAIGAADTAEIGNRIGLATLLLLISMVGGRIIPSFTRNWLTKAHPAAPPPTLATRFDLSVLAATGVALAAWAAAPDARMTACAAILAGAGLALRLARWRGGQTFREPLLAILHIGYGWLALGLLLLGLDRFAGVLPATAALHALTVGAVGTMTLAVMTRASLGHTGRPLAAGPGTCLIYALITTAAILRVLTPLAGAATTLALWLAGAAWSAAFFLFAVLYGGILAQPRGYGGVARVI